MPVIEKNPDTINKALKIYELLLQIDILESNKKHVNITSHSKLDQDIQVHKVRLSNEKSAIAQFIQSDSDFFKRLKDKVGTLDDSEMVDALVKDQFLRALFLTAMENEFDNHDIAKKKAQVIDEMMPVKWFGRRDDIASQYLAYKKLNERHYTQQGEQKKAQRKLQDIERIKSLGAELHKDEKAAMNKAKAALEGGIGYQGYTKTVAGLEAEMQKMEADALPISGLFLMSELRNNMSGASRLTQEQPSNYKKVVERIHQGKFDASLMNEIQQVDSWLKQLQANYLSQTDNPTRDQLLKAIDGWRTIEDALLRRHKTLVCDVAARMEKDIQYRRTGVQAKPNTIDLILQAREKNHNQYSVISRIEAETFLDAAEPYSYLIRPSQAKPWEILLSMRLPEPAKVQHIAIDLHSKEARDVDAMEAVVRIAIADYIAANNPQFAAGESISAIPVQADDIKDLYDRGLMVTSSATAQVPRGLQHANQPKAFQGYSGTILAGGASHSSVSSSSSSSSPVPEKLTLEEMQKQIEATERQLAELKATVQNQQMLDRLQSLKT